MNKILTVLVSIIVAGVIVGASLPVFAGFSNGEKIHNDGAGWIRFNYDTNASEYEISLTESEDAITITNGSDTQTYSADNTEEFNTILYADTNLSVWVDDDNIHVLGLVDGEPYYMEGSGDFTITRTADGVTFGAGDDGVTFDAPTWAYVPWSGGSYGFFTPSEEGVITYPADMPNAIVGGGFAGVYAYNDIYRYDGLGLVMTPTYNGDKLTGAGWAKPAIEPDPQQITITPLDPSVIGGDVDIQPIDPITIDPEPDASIMGVPTPTYTEGDWGYDLMTVGEVQKAKIVSYSGSGDGPITIPAVVGGYDVIQVGKGGFQENVFNTSLSATDLIISNGVTTIGPSALYNCSSFTGSLTIPSSVTNIGNNAFYNCSRFTGSLTIPSSVTNIGGYAFSGCSGFTELIIVNDTAPSNNAFSMSGLTEVLDLSSTVDYSVDRYGIPAGAVVQDNIGDCFGFISVVDYSIGSDTGVVADIIPLIPLVVVAGLVIMAGAMLVYRKV